jgi:hypothetical protein
MRTGSYDVDAAFMLLLLHEGANHVVWGGPEYGQ